MKKILSLVMVVAMLVAVLALVGCDLTNKPADDTTTEATTTEGTTAGTTEGTTTSATTAPSDTTETTTLPPVFARFDFGEKSKAQDLKMTSHAYLMKALEYVFLTDAIQTFNTMEEAVEYIEMNNFAF